MKLKWFMSIFVSLFLMALLSLLILINFYKEKVQEFLPGIDVIYIPTISIIIVFIILYYLLRKEKIQNELHYDFTTIITHKIRTPISGLKWAIQMLSGDISLQQKQDLIKQMQNANERLLETVDLLADFAKFDQRLDYAYEATFMREIVEASIQKYAEHIREKNIRFDIQSATNIPAIIIDKKKIQFAIDMVLNNAIKYTPANGHVEIGFINKNKALIIYIKDNGIGMRRRDKRKVFKKFFRSEQAKKIDTEGMGLGLYTVRKIIKHHGGKMWVESSGENKGSTFFIKLYY